MANMKKIRKRKTGFKATALLLSLLITGGALAAPTSSIQAEAATTSTWEEYSLLTLLQASLINTYTDSEGIYTQLKAGIKYRTITESDILQLISDGYDIPVDTLWKLAEEGWISGYLYKTVAGLSYEPDDFAGAFDAAYYMTNNAIVLEAVASGALAADEYTLFLHWLTCGIPAGLNASNEFNFEYFEAAYPSVCAQLGYNKMAEVIYYVMNSTYGGVVGNG